MSTSQWYDAQGEASTKGVDAQTARRHAMENALQKALLIAGASVSSVQQVVNGLLTHDQVSIRASGIINSLDLISESYANNKVIVTIRADIFPQEHQCTSADYKKSLLITKTNLLHRAHANIGQIYTLDTSLGKQLAKKLRAKSQFIDAHLGVQQRTQFSRLNNSFQLEKIKQMAMSLADKTDSQYIMFSEFTDLSFGKDVNNSWQFWQEDIFDRRFNLAVYIYNGVNGENIFEEHYNSTAPWEFGKRENLDVNGTVFWNSQYGSIINQTLNTLIADLDEQLMCQQSRGKIVQANADSITINLGKRHGLQIGDELSVLHLANFISDDKKLYAGFNISPYKVTITQLSNDSAKAVTTNGHVLGSIQINDIVVRN